MILSLKVVCDQIQPLVNIKESILNCFYIVFKLINKDTNIEFSIFTYLSLYNNRDI